VIRILSLAKELISMRQPVASSISLLIFVYPASMVIDLAFSGLSSLNATGGLPCPFIMCWSMSVRRFIWSFDVLA
jgi:hypothetical protein